MSAGNHLNYTGSYLFATWEIILFARINTVMLSFKNEGEAMC